MRKCLFVIMVLCVLSVFSTGCRKAEEREVIDAIAEKTALKDEAEGEAVSGQERIGAEAAVPVHPRSIYSRYVNWRPAHGETVKLNPPRMSWPLWADWPPTIWSNTLHTFTLQISSNKDCSNPAVNVTTPFNFYNTIPELKGIKTWYWRVGYDAGTDKEKWSTVRSFTIAEDAVVWDRSALKDPYLGEHPRILFNNSNIEKIRKLAQTDPGSKAALEYMRKDADRIMKKPWWDDFPQTDRGKEPEQEFYKIARDLVTVCFVWRMTEDDKYAGVKQRAVIWASYPPQGRSSPEGLGGDGDEDATQGNEFLALLFDWLYPDLTEEERDTMIWSLEWRVDHAITFAWKVRSNKGPMLRLTFSSDVKTGSYEAEDFELTAGARIIEHEKASGGKLVEFATREAALSIQVMLDKGPYAITLRGYGSAGDRDAFYLMLDNNKKQRKRVYINGWGEKAVSINVPEAGEHTITLSADPREIGMTVDRLHFGGDTDKRLRLRTTRKWLPFTWEVQVPSQCSKVAVELFNYYAGGEVWWDSLTVSSEPDGLNLLSNGDFSEGEKGLPAGWRTSSFKTGSEFEFSPQSGRNDTGAAGIICPGPSDRGAWYQDITVGVARRFFIKGWYRTSPSMNKGNLVSASSMSGRISSHPYESSMDTAVCALALYGHSEIGRQWFDLICNYLIGITCGYGFDESWNEGAGYGSSKCKWLMNATMYFDTTLPEANLDRNPYYKRIGDFFSRIIPLGMPYHAWGNQINASRWNHRSHFRKFAYLTGEGRFLLNWKEYGGKLFSEFRPWIEYVLPAYYKAPEPEPEKDHVGFFPIGGWVMAATGPPSLASTFKEGMGIIFQCRPRGGYSHSFNSDSSFQLHAYGQNLNHGGGGAGNLDAFVFHTMSHNTILIDGLGMAQPGQGQMYPYYGRIAAFKRGDDYVYFAGDPTQCYPKKPGNFSRYSLPMHKIYQDRALPYLKYFIRHILFMRGKYFVIYDDLLCSKPATYTWLYHILPEDPINFDQRNFIVDYAVGDVKVRLQMIAHPDKLDLDDRKGMDAFINPFTGEDYRKLKKGNILCGHNLWISSTEPAEKWNFLTVIYPAKQGMVIPPIERIDDHTVRVGDDLITFDPKGPGAKKAGFVVDVEAIRGR